MKPFARTVWFGLVALFLVFGFMVWHRVHRQPTYGNRTAREWLPYLTSRSAQARWKALEALRALDSNALPVLLEKLTERDSAVSSNLTRLAARVKVVKLYSRLPKELVFQGQLNLLHAEKDHRQALDGFAALGPKAKPAIPDLMKLLDRPDVAGRAIFILKELDDDVIPWLLQAATNANPNVRSAVMHELGMRRSTVPGVMKTLLSGLSDTNAEVRGRSAYSLARFPAYASDIVPTLIPLVNDSDVEVRSIAAQSLGEFGQSATSAIPALVQAAQRDGRGSASGALWKIDPDAARRAGVPEMRSRPNYE